MAILKRSTKPVLRMKKSLVQTTSREGALLVTHNAASQSSSVCEGPMKVCPGVTQDPWGQDPINSTKCTELLTPWLESRPTQV
ncbi:hypothetical protein E5288_WYG022186 [Bos mutus]|uniref:Uncharacterized protein n=1 Tax=Bos mutus TaxID=72004 RepID=A0A6B0RHG0_9CETA|nr:hypothetical protein [Bos mutus]